MYRNQPEWIVQTEDVLLTQDRWKERTENKGIHTLEREPSVGYSALNSVINIDNKVRTNLILIFRKALKVIHPVSSSGHVFLPKSDDILVQHIFPFSYWFILQCCFLIERFSLSGTFQVINVCCKMLFLLVSTMVVCLWVSLSTVNWYFYCLYLFYCIFYLHHSEWREYIPSTLSGRIIYWLGKKVCSHIRGHWDTLLFLVQHCATFLVTTTSCPLLWAWWVEFLSSINTFFNVI